MQKRVCSQCVYAASDPGHFLAFLTAGLGATLTCANCEDCPGKLRHVPPNGTCRNFQARRDKPVWTTPPEPPSDDIRYIPLTKGYFAIVDAADYDWLSQYKWTTQIGGNKVYPVRNDHGRSVLMHRQIMQPNPDQVVDHVNGNGLDQRRANMRCCTQGENLCNRKPCAKKSQYKGVRWLERKQKWAAVITHHGRTYWLGTFDTEEAAARAYDRRARVLFGPYARLNFPEDPATP
jgi:hypothetical protein